MINDIIFCADDYINNFSTNETKTIIDISDYVYTILIKIHGKKIIYIEYIEQVISEHFLKYNTNYNFIDNTELNSIRVKELVKKPQSVQRSVEWFNQRKNSIGASELACIFNKNPFCSNNKFILKKAGYVEPTSANINIYCQHGIKYEEIVTKIYSERTHQTVLEFGSIEHETYSFIRASPDGISTTGIMLEIKVPLSRKLYGIPPIYYWYQVQQQLEVANLNSCDFVECKIEEYYQWKEFLNDNYKGDYSKTIKNMEKGIVVEYITHIDSTNSLNYFYPDKINYEFKTKSEWESIIYNQVSELKSKIGIKSNRIFSRILPWKVNEYSCIRIFRNKYWWDSNFYKIEQIWEKILYHKKHGYESLIKVTKPRKKKTSLNDNYSFILDE